MDPKNQSTTQPTTRNPVVATVTGGAMGGIVGWIVSRFNKKASLKKQLGIGVAAGALLGLASNLLTKKTAIPTSEDPALQLPPAQAPGLALEQVPQLLDLLVSRQQITAQQKIWVLDSIKSGRQGFAGEIVIASGYATSQVVAQAIADQASMKAEAALVDIQNILTYGSRPATQLKAYWGNNGVNPAAPHPARFDGMSAAANIAQNLVALANATPNNPELVTAASQGVLAAANLARGIAEGDSAVVPLAKMSDYWRTTMNNTLQLVAKASGQPIADANGKPIDIQQFITARNGEIAAAVEQAIAASNNRNQSAAR